MCRSAFFYALFLLNLCLTLARTIVYAQLISSQRHARPALWGKIGVAHSTPATLNCLQNLTFHNFMGFGEVDALLLFFPSFAWFFLRSTVKHRSALYLHCVHLSTHNSIYFQVDFELQIHYITGNEYECEHIEVLPPVWLRAGQLFCQSCQGRLRYGIY